MNEIFPGRRRDGIPSYNCYSELERDVVRALRTDPVRGVSFRELRVLFGIDFEIGDLTDIVPLLWQRSHLEIVKDLPGLRLAKPRKADFSRFGKKW